MNDTNTNGKQRPSPAELPIQYHRIDAQNTRWTFKAEGLRKFIESKLNGRVLNAYCGKTTLRHDNEIIRVDSDETITADIHCDVRDLDEYFDSGAFDTVIADPPYSERKAHEKYGPDAYRGRFAQALDVLGNLVAQGGRSIVTGYQSCQMGRSRGFILSQVCLVNHPGDVNDTIIPIETRIDGDLLQYDNTSQQESVGTDIDRYN